MTSLISAVVVMLVIGALLGLLLGVADKFLAVPVDPRVETVSGMLPNYNCGGCGYAGCSGRLSVPGDNERGVRLF